MPAMAAPASRGSIAAAAASPRDQRDSGRNRGLHDDKAQEIGRKRRRLGAKDRFAEGVAVDETGHDKQRSPDQGLQRASRGDHRACDHHRERHQHFGIRQRDAANVHRHADRGGNDEQRRNGEVETGDTDGHPHRHDEGEMIEADHGMGEPGKKALP